MTKNSNLTLTLILGVLTAFAPLSIDMYLASMPTLERDFNTTAHTVQLTLASFFVGFSLGQAFYGPLSDKYGRKLPLYFGMAIFVLSSIGCALSSSIESLMFFRFLQAVGACSGGVIARAIVRDLYHPNDASKIYSYLMLVSGLAPMLAPVAGGYILIALGWKAIFLILAAMGTLALVSVKFWLVESYQADLSRSIAPKNVLREYMVLLKHKHFMGYTLATGFAMAGMFAYITASPFVFIDTFHLSIEHYGMLFGANAACFITAAQINARLVNKVDSAKLLVVPLILLAVFGMIMFLDAFFHIGGFFGIVAPLFGFMFCIGFVVPNAAALAMAPFAANAGSASALLGTIQFSMAAISSFILGAMQKTAVVSMGAMAMLCGVLAVSTYLFMIKEEKAVDLDAKETTV